MTQKHGGAPIEIKAGDFQTVAKRFGQGHLFKARESLQGLGSHDRGLAIPPVVGVATKRIHGAGIAKDLTNVAAGGGVHGEAHL